MSRKLVGITSGLSASGENQTRRHFLNHLYVRAIEDAGATPLIIPSDSLPLSIAQMVQLFDGILLTGGADIEPARYNRSSHPALGETEPERDDTEFALIRNALRENLPIFAICRGIQALNVAMGGSLYQDLPSEIPSHIHHQQTTQKIPRNQPTHTILIEPDCLLRKIVGKSEIEVNSLHHQALEEVAQGLVVSATAPDGVIEAVEAPGQRWVVGVQFHPEELAPFYDSSRELFRAFVEAL